MLLYAVARVAFNVSGYPSDIARQSEPQCNIGFQPVSFHTIERRFSPAHDLSIKLRLHPISATLVDVERGFRDLCPEEGAIALSPGFQPWETVSPKRRALKGLQIARVLHPSNAS
jgi:hypothetical protein